MFKNKLALVYLSLVLLFVTVQSKLIECPYESLPKNQIKGMEFLGKGYNIFLGSPLKPIEKDEGLIVDKTVFDFTQSQTTSSVDKKWTLPDGIQFNSVSSCDTSFTSRAYETMQSYTKALQKDALIEGMQQPSGAFSASSSYQQQLQNIQSNKLVIDSKAECLTGHLSLLNTASQHPILTNEIFDDLLKVSRAKKNEKEEYYNFFDKYGTHVISSVKLGSRLTFTATLNESQASALKYRGYNIETGMNIKSLSLVNSNTYPFFSSNRHFKLFNSTNATFNTTLKGVSYPSDNNIIYPSEISTKWLQETLNQPVHAPISFTLIGFDQLLANYTKRETGYLNEYDINKLSKGFAVQISNYCNDRLKLKYPQISCSDSTAGLSMADKPSEIQYFAMNSMQIYITGFGQGNYTSPQWYENFTSPSLTVDPYRFAMPKGFSLEPDQYFRLVRAATQNNFYYIYNEVYNSCLTEFVDANSIGYYQLSFCNFNLDAIVESQLFAFELGNNGLYVIKNVKSQKNMKIGESSITHTTENSYLRVAQAIPTTLASNIYDKLQQKQYLHQCYQKQQSMGQSILQCKPNTTEFINILNEQNNFMLINTEQSLFYYGTEGNQGEIKSDKLKLEGINYARGNWRYSKSKSDNPTANQKSFCGKQNQIFVFQNDMGNFDATVCATDVQQLFFTSIYFVFERAVDRSGFMPERFLMLIQTP